MQEWRHFLCEALLSLVFNEACGTVPGLDNGGSFLFI